MYQDQHPKYDRAQILQTIDHHELGHTLRTFATEFAILGYLDIAQDLVSLINKHAPFSHRTNTFGFKPLWLIWDMTDSWPEGEEEFVREYFVAELSGRESEWKYDQQQQQKETVAKLAREYETSLWEMAGFKGENEHVFDETKLAKCVEKLRNSDRDGNKWVADAITGGAAMTKGSVLVTALNIAIVLKEERKHSSSSSYANKDLPEVEEILEWIAKRLHANQMMVYLTNSAKAWGLLKEGALAKALGVDDAKVRELGREVLDTFKIRYEKGVQRSGMWDKSVRELIQIISDNTVENPAAKEFREEVRGPRATEEEDIKTILHAPLPSNDITTLEKRLDISLPEDYKDFLAATDGIDSSWGSIVMDPLLYRASKVRWLASHEDNFDADILRDVFETLRPVYDSGKWPKVGTPLWIGLEDIDAVWLLPPSKVKEIVKMYMDQRNQNSNADTRFAIEKSIVAWAGSIEAFEAAEWFVVTSAGGGAYDMRAYPSFKAFLVSKAEASERDNGNLPAKVCFSYTCR